MPKTYTLHHDEESAAILILRGVHRIEPVSTSKDIKTGRTYSTFQLEAPDILFGYESAYELAEKDGDTSDQHILWRYINNELLGEFSDTDFAEAYENATH